MKVATLTQEFVCSPLSLACFGPPQIVPVHQELEKEKTALNSIRAVS
jgi:hypothetical protein